MKKEDAIAQYEQLLLHGKKFRLWGSPTEKSNGAKDIIKYVITDMLQWDVADAAAHFSGDIVRRLQLDIILKYVIFPKEMRGNKYEYLIQICFPDKYKFDFKKHIAALYDGILSGQVKRFPREEFSDANGIEKASIILQQFISYNIPTSDVTELYERFSHFQEMEKLFNEKKIYFVYVRFYNTPVEYLHYSLSYEERDTFLFSFYSFINLYELKKKEKEAD